MCGTSEIGLTTTSALDASILSKGILPSPIFLEPPLTYPPVVAAVQYGDPSHVTGQPQDVGTSTKNGILPRGKACGSITSVMKSYCDSGDPFCDSGVDIATHLSYFGTYDGKAAAFIESQVKGNATEA